MKKMHSGIISLLLITLVSCGHTRFKTYRSISVNVIDKKINEEQAQFYRVLQELKDSFDVAVEKSLNGEKSTPWEMYDSMLYATHLQNGSLDFKPQDIILPIEMNPRWIEITPGYLIFEDNKKAEIKKFKVTSIDKQEGVDDAGWLIKIDDDKIEQAVLTDGVLQLKSGTDGHYDYAYTFNNE
jgi:hypothetical protein